MGLRNALYYHLTNDSNVTNVVATRVYPTVAPQDAAFPRITFQKIGNDHIHHMQGGAGIAAARFQIGCWDDDALGADALAEVVRVSLDQQGRATLGSGAGSTAALSRAFLDFEREDYEAPELADQVGVYSVKMDFTLWYAESVVPP